MSNQEEKEITLSSKDISLILMICCLFVIVPLGWSIRTFIDNYSYLELSITIGLAVFCILQARIYYKIAFNEVIVES